MNRIKEKFGSQETMALAGAAVTATTAISLGFGALTVLPAAAAGGAASWYEYISRDKPSWLAMTVLVPHTEKYLDSLGCQQYTTTKEI